MMKRFLALLAICGAISLAPAAQASSITFHMTRTSSGNSFTFNGCASATITSYTIIGHQSCAGTDFSMGAYTGTYLVVQAGTMNLAGVSTTWDNKLFAGPGTHPFDGDGVLLKLNGSDDLVHIFYNSTTKKVVVDIYNKTGATLLLSESFPNFNLGRSGSSLSPTPEPSSLFLFGTGVLIFALMFYWKERRARKQKPSETPIKLAA